MSQDEAVRKIRDILLAHKGDVATREVGGTERMLAQHIYDEFVGPEEAHWKSRLEAAGERPKDVEIATVLLRLVEQHATVLGMANTILARDNGRASTHSQECWMWHVTCFAKTIKEVLSVQEEATEPGEAE